MKTQSLLFVICLFLTALSEPAAQAGTGYEVVQAQLMSNARQQGVVRTGMMQWHCRANLCSSKVRDDVNLLKACISLAQKVGKVKSFEISHASATTGKQGTAAEYKKFSDLMVCNQQAENTGRDMLTTRLQSEIQDRSQEIQLGTQIMENVNKSRDPVIRNLR